MVLGRNKPSLTEKFNILGHIWPLVASALLEKKKEETKLNRILNFLLYVTNVPLSIAYSCLHGPRSSHLHWLLKFLWCIFPSVHSIMLRLCLFITVMCRDFFLFVLFCLARQPHSLSCLTFTNDLLSDLLNVFCVCFKRFFILIALVRNAPLPRQQHLSMSLSLTGCFKGATRHPATPRANDPDCARVEAASKRGIRKNVEPFQPVT